jgi:hypothetical protein
MSPTLAEEPRSQANMETSRAVAVMIRLANGYTAVAPGHQRFDEVVFGLSHGSPNATFFPCRSSPS